MLFIKQKIPPYNKTRRKIHASCIDYETFSSFIRILLWNLILSYDERSYLNKRLRNTPHAQKYIFIQGIPMYDLWILQIPHCNWNLVKLEFVNFLQLSLTDDNVAIFFSFVGSNNKMLNFVCLVFYMKKAIAHFHKLL